MQILYLNTALEKVLAPQVSPLLAQSTHLRRAMGILLCPIVRHWLTTLTSLRIFTSFTHMHTHLQNRHRTLTRGWGGESTHIYFSLSTHTLITLMWCYLIFFHSHKYCVYAFFISFILSLTRRYTNDIHTDMYVHKYCTHTHKDTHSHFLACRLALKGVKWLNVLKALGKHGSSSAPQADIICPASLQSGVYIQLHL